ncbi:MAG: hypothetical protein QM493_01440 [Sulfurovum sp.]
MFKKMLFVIMLINSTLMFAKVTHINYDAKFGIFGTIGSLNTKLTQNRRSYTIDTKMALTGLAKRLFSRHKGRYISKGHIRNGLMITDLYQIIERYDDMVVSKEYWTDHKRKKVTLKVKKWKKGKLIQNSKKRLKFYAKNDLLTLYFNLDKMIPKKGKKYNFKVVGLEKQNGTVKITVPSNSQSGSYKKDLGDTANWYAKALIHQKNFRKKKGDILMSVSKDGYIKKAVIKDILMYGDASLVRVR